MHGAGQESQTLSVAHNTLGKKVGLELVLFRIFFNVLNSDHSTSYTLSLWIFLSPFPDGFRVLKHCLRTSPHLVVGLRWSAWTFPLQDWTCSLFEGTVRPQKCARSATSVSVEEPLTANGVRAFASLLATSSTKIQSLNLSRVIHNENARQVKKDNEAVETIVASLVLNPTLRMTSLRMAEITDDNLARKIASMCVISTSLISLDVTDCDMGDKGTLCSAEGLQNATTHDLRFSVVVGTQG